MVRSRTKEPELCIVLDFGGSLTKGIYRDKSGEATLFSMEPEVISLPKTSIDEYEALKMGTPDPTDSAWVGCGDDYYAVGYLARSQFYGNAGLSSFKYERAFPKTLAAVWAVAHRLGLTQKKKISAAIGVLLPAGEYENAELLKEFITEGLANFSTPTGTMSVSLTHYQSKPEGGGVLMVYATAQGAAVLKTKTVAVVMVGYRNASILVSERGVVGKRVTSPLGFVRLVELVEKRISTLVNTARLATAIALAGESIKTAPLMPLAMSSQQESRLSEVEKLVSAISSSRTQYLHSLSSWLRENLPKELDEVILCGGTAYYLRDSLEKFFSSCSVEVVWDGDMELPLHLQTQDLGRRMCDVYGMYRYFTTTMLKSNKVALVARES